MKKIELQYQFGTSGQNRDTIVINESGLYSLIMSSKLPKIKESLNQKNMCVTDTLTKKLISFLLGNNI